MVRIIGMIKVNDSQLVYCATTLTMTLSHWAKLGCCSSKAILLVGLRYNSFVETIYRGDPNPTICTYIWYNVSTFKELRSRRETGDLVYYSWFSTKQFLSYCVAPYWTLEQIQGAKTSMLQPISLVIRLLPNIGWRALPAWIYKIIIYQVGYI